MSWLSWTLSMGLPGDHGHFSMVLQTRCLDRWSYPHDQASFIQGSLRSEVKSDTPTVSQVGESDRLIYTRSLCIQLMVDTMSHLYKVSLYPADGRHFVSSIPGPFVSRLMVDTLSYLYQVSLYPADGRHIVSSIPGLFVSSWWSTQCLIYTRSLCIETDGRQYVSSIPGIFVSRLMIDTLSHLYHVSLYPSDGRHIVSSIPRLFVSNWWSTLCLICTRSLCIQTDSRRFAGRVRRLQ